jgi:hypothetical protein
MGLLQSGVEMAVDALLNLNTISLHLCRIGLKNEFIAVRSGHGF